MKFVRVVPLKFPSSDPASMHWNTQLKSLEHLWAPFLCILRLAGLYHFNSTEKEQGFWKSWSNPWKIYSAIVLLVCVVIFLVRVGPARDQFDFSSKTATYLSISNIFYHVYVTELIRCFFVASNSATKFRRLHKVWLELRFHREDAQKVEKKVKSGLWLTILVAGLIFTVCVTAIALKIILRNVQTHLFFVFFLFILQSAECLSIAFIVIICLSILAAISAFNSRFAWHINNSPESLLTMTQWTRLRSTFNSLVQLIKVTDDILHVCLGCAIFATLVQVIFISSTFTFSSDSIVQIEILWWSVTFYFAIFALFWITAEVNAMIYASFDDLSSLKISSFPATMQNELMFFQNRLGNQTFGITLFKMHVITRGTLSSVTSLYVTYLFITIQFLD